MKAFLDKVAKTGEVMAQRVMKRSKREIQEEFKDKLSPVYALLHDYEVKLNNQRQFHVAIARCMELYNLIAKETENEEVHTIGYVYLLQALYPFVPHMTSEIWSKMSLSITQ